MAQGLLGSIVSSGSGDFVVPYTVPAGYWARVDANVIAQLSPSKVKLYVSESGTPSADDQIQFDSLKTSKPGYNRGSLVLSAGERVIINTDKADVVAKVFGFEFPITTGRIQGLASKGQITTNTTTTAHTVAASTAGTFNLSVTLDGTVGGYADVTVYISSDGTADAIDLLQKETISYSGITGFERTFTLDAGKRIMIKTDNLVGNIAYRVYGFDKAV